MPESSAPAAGQTPIRSLARRRAGGGRLRLRCTKRLRPEVDGPTEAEPDRGVVGWARRKLATSRRPRGSGSSAPPAELRSARPASPVAAVAGKHEHGRSRGLSPQPPRLRRRPRAPRRPIPPTALLAQLAYVIVNEAGASVYSTSPVGREELPEFDATLRSTISIGRRLQDPLAELVKIEPQNIGVGLYQHDVNPKQLKESLESVISSCVNFVGRRPQHRQRARCCGTSRA